MTVSVEGYCPNPVICHLQKLSQQPSVSLELLQQLQQKNIQTPEVAVLVTAQLGTITEVMGCHIQQSTAVQVIRMTA